MNPGLKIFMVFLLTVSMAACAGHNQERGGTTRQHIAESYGIQYFGEV